MAKVFIIEDNATIAKIWKVQLERCGYEVVISTNGPEAIEMAPKVQPDIILSDVMLPGMSGFEIVQRLKERQETKHIPVIILSATNSPQNKERAILLGVHKYIVKSECTPRQLSDSVAAALALASKTN